MKKNFKLKSAINILYFSAIALGFSIDVKASALSDSIVLRFQPKYSFSGSDPNAAARNCLVAAGLYRKELGNGDAQFLSELKRSVGRSADFIFDQSKKWRDGWGEPTRWMGLPIDTAFSWDTGLPLMCLAEAADILTEPRYKILAFDVANAWLKLGYKSASSICSTCSFFGYALAKGYYGLHAKNTSVLMGAAFLTIDRYFPNERFRNAGMESVRSQYKDIVSRKNYFYLGSSESDWQWSIKKWDNHNYFEAIILARVGDLLKSKSYFCAAFTQYKAWTKGGRTLFSGERLEKHNRAVADASCAFEDHDSSARAECKKRLGSNGKLNPSIALLGLSSDYWETRSPASCK